MNARNDMPLVTGSAGRLGTALQAAMAERHSAAVFATRDELDVCDYFRLVTEFERLEPTVVINTASLTHVDGCEETPELADAINHVGARNVARAAKQVGARVIQVSTDFVFDGELDRHYIEEDAPAPISVYGRTKLAGEAAVLEESPSATILRASWYFGSGEGSFPGNFISMIEEGSPLGLVADRYGTPTYIPDLAEAITRLVSIPWQGVLHFTNGGDRTTRYHFILRAARRLSLDLAPLHPISHLNWKGDRARRPINSALNPSRFIEVTGWAPRTWEEAQDAWIAARDHADPDF
jgi:dTDP-4-dehydrorhamnose reductase